MLVAEKAHLWAGYLAWMKAATWVKLVPLSAQSSVVKKAGQLVLRLVEQMGLLMVRWMAGMMASQMALRWVLRLAAMKAV